MRRLTAFVLSIAVLAGMTFTTLADPVEDAGGVQEETVLPAQQNITDDDENVIGGDETFPSVSVGDDAPVNLALGKTAYTSYARGDGLHDPTKLTDGDLTTVSQGWGSTETQCIIVDLGSSQAFSKVMVRLNNGRKITTWAVQYTDVEAPGTTAGLNAWKDVSSSDWQNAKTGELDDSTWDDKTVQNLEVTFAPKTARYVRFCVTGVTSNTDIATKQLIKWYEFEVYYEASEVPVPVLRLKGDSSVRLALGQEYEEAGFTADDGSGNDISSQVEISGNVNNKKTGTYTLTYSIPSLSLTATRTVEVYAEALNLAATNGASDGSTLSLSYKGNTYDSASVQWLLSDSETGSYTPIEGATGRTYTIKYADKDKYIKAQAILGEGYEAVTSSGAAHVGNVAFKGTLTSNQDAGGGGALANVTDGNTATNLRQRWGSTNDTTYCINLGSEQYVDRMVVYSLDSTANGSHKINGWKVQYSNAETPAVAADSADWTDIEDASPVTDTSTWTVQTINFAPVKARHIRFVVTTLFAGWSGAYWINEIEVFNTHAVEKPVITLNGDAAMSVNIGETFTDPGATALDSDGLSNIDVTVGGDTVNTVTPGRYTITYNVTGSNGVAAEEKTRVVTVVAANPPVITLKGGKEMTVYQNRTFTDPGATAVDLNNADISANIVVTGTVDTTKLGDYTLEYNVTDSRGVAAAAVMRTVHVVEAKPVLTLKGDAEMAVVQGRPFTDPGVTAVDADGNDLTESVVVSVINPGATEPNKTGTVDTNIPGIYTIRYNVEDAAGIAAESVTRKVTVISTAVSLTYTSAMPGGVLSASYVWDGYDTANGAAYQWVRASSIDGSFEPITGATGETYTLSAADVNKYIKLTITPAGAPAVTTPNHVSVGNIALGKNITSTVNHGSGPAVDMLDGNKDTCTRAYGSTPLCEYTIDLGGERQISMARLFSHGDSARKIKHFTIDYTTEASVSKTTKWTTLADVPVNTTAVNSLDKVVWNFDRVTARHVRINIDDGVANADYSGTWYFDEFELYNAANGTPTLTLKGEEKMSVERGGTFVDPGVTAVDEAGVDLSAAVVVSGDTVDTSKLGTYIVNYDVTDAWGNVAQTVTRTVVVHEIDTQPPVIHLNGAATIRIHQDDTWTDPGVLVTDNIDTDVSATIGGDTVDTKTLGEYIITYDAVDRSGNRAQQVTRKVVVVAKDEDVEPPVVTLNGAAEVEVWQGYSYTEQGATARDGSTDVTGSIKMEGSVNTAVLGTYVLTYSVSDAAGNIGIATRIVKVVEEPAIERDTRELKIEGASNLQAIVKDLILRNRGTYGSTITWESSNENVIRPDGTVIRPSNGNAVVTLTATITNGGEVRKKTFDPVTVLQSTGSTGGGGGSSTGGGRPGGVTNTVSGSGGGTTNPVTPSEPSTPQQPGNGTLSGFSDMNQAAWADLAVSELSKRGILNGVGDGTFQPQRAVTREEFVKIVVEAFGFGTGTAAANFSDVSAQEWYYPYVASATQLGIVGGTGDGFFGTGRAITREEMAAIICRAAEAKGLELKADKEKEDFADNGTISDWARENVYALQQAGIISGMGDGTFAPGQQCTRAEAAKVVYELTKYMW